MCSDLTTKPMSLLTPLLFPQTPTFKKPRSCTSTAEQEGIWAASTRSSRTCRGSWWPTSRRSCREGRLCRVSLRLLARHKALCFRLAFIFSSLFSSLHSTRLQGQQLVQPVQEVQERRQIPEHPLHLRQAGGRRRLFHHAHRLRALLVALSDETTGGGGGGEEEGEGGREVENEPHRVCGREEKTFAFDEKQDPCFKGDFTDMPYHCSVCPCLVHAWVFDLK